jgi:hypothetical protein
MKTRHLGMAIAMAAVMVPAASRAQEAVPAAATDVEPVSVRSGFTAELGLGAGMTMISPEMGDSENKAGLSGLTLGLGAFVTDRIAVLGRVSGTTFNQDVLGDDHMFVNSLLLVGGQYWVNDAFTVTAGAGLGVFGPSPFDSLDGVDNQNGLALSAGAGYSFLVSGQHALRAALEVMPAFYDGATVVGSGLRIEWQYL